MLEYKFEILIEALTIFTKTYTYNKSEQTKTCIIRKDILRAVFSMMTQTSLHIIAV